VRRPSAKEVREEVLARPGRLRVINDTIEVKEVVVGTGERRRRYIVCRNQEERPGSASIARRS
jgi:hypothetical protein